VSLRDGLGMQLPSLAVQYGMDLTDCAEKLMLKGAQNRRILTPENGCRTTDRCSHTGIQLHLLPS
jgi:hypothetical protein